MALIVALAATGASFAADARCETEPKYLGHGELARDIAFGLRVSAMLGVGGIVEPVTSSATGPYGGTSLPQTVGWNGLAARVGIDGEYWINNHFGVGAEGSAEGFGTGQPNFLGASEGGMSAGTAVYSLAPAVTFRLTNATYIPLVSLALGYAWGSASLSTYCDPAYFNIQQCIDSEDSRRLSGLYGGATAAWLFHVGGLAIGPLTKIEGFTLFGAVPTWTVTAGIAIGAGIRR